MLIMYREVLAQEKKIAKFGAAALNLRKGGTVNLRKKKKDEMDKKEADSNIVSHPRGKNGAPGNEKGEKNDADDEEEARTLNDGANPVSSNKEQESNGDTSPTSCNRFLTILLQNRLCRPFRLLITYIQKAWKECGGGKSNNSGRQTRAIMNKALSYSLAFSLSYLFPIIISIRTLAGSYSGHTLSVMARVLFPLQGFFNFVVFIHPKVVAVKNKGNRRGQESISWFGAFVKVVTVKEQQQGLNRSTNKKGGRTNITAVTKTVSFFLSSFRNHAGGMMKKASASASSSLRKNRKKKQSASSSSLVPANADANEKEAMISSITIGGTTEDHATPSACTAGASDAEKLVSTKGA